MHPDLLVSTQTEPDLTIIDGELNSSWQYIGRIDGSRETALWKAVQPYVGIKGRITAAKFHADCSLDSPWVADLLERHPGLKHGLGAGSVDDEFWLALDMRQYHRRYLVTVQPATITANPHRTPEPHPGEYWTPTFIPMQVHSKAGDVFTHVPVG